MSQRRPLAWRNYQWSEDYYEAGKLVWLDADQLIREKTGGKKSLDDFARTFFGVRDRDWGVLPYTFDDVVAALNKVMPYDWATFLNTRINQVKPHATLDWITRGGYKLTYTDKPSSYWKSNEKRRKGTDLSYSIGLTIGKDGAISSVVVGRPGLRRRASRVGSKLIAVNGRDYDSDGLKAAITDAKGGTAADPPADPAVRPVSATSPYQWNGGLRYPTLEKVGKGESGLDKLLMPQEISALRHRSRLPVQGRGSVAPPLRISRASRARACGYGGVMASTLSSRQPHRAGALPRLRHRSWWSALPIAAPLIGWRHGMHGELRLPPRSSSSSRLWPC